MPVGGPRRGSARGAGGTRDRASGPERQDGLLEVSPLQNLHYLSRVAWARTASASAGRYQACSGQATLQGLRRSLPRISSIFFIEALDS